MPSLPPAFNTAAHEYHPYFISFSGRQAGKKKITKGLYLGYAMKTSIE